MDPIAADEIGAAVDPGQEFGNIGGIILQITVQQHHHRAPRHAHARQHGRALARVFLKEHQPHFG